MSLNSYLVTDEIRPLPGSGWTSKNAASRADSIVKYKEKLNISRGQKGYIDPAVFNIKDNFNKDDLMNIEPKMSCVVEKPECVKYNYVIPKEYLQDGIETAKVENQILEQQQSDNALQQQNTLIKEELDAALEIIRNMENIGFEKKFDFKVKLDELKGKLDELKGKLNELKVKLEQKDEELYSRFKQWYSENPEVPGEGGTRHKKPIKRTKTHKRRITKRLRSKKIPRKFQENSKKIPRKCFSRRKREK